MGLKDLLLNKGWAGKTMTRHETIERINPLIRQLYELNHSYEFAIGNVSDPEIAKHLQNLQRTARVDGGKLSETVLSAGGISYNGVGLESEDFGLGSSEADVIPRLKELESDFEHKLSAELEQNHQIRTKAILSVVLGNSRARLEFLRGVVRQSRRPTSTEPSHS